MKTKQDQCFTKLEEKVRQIQGLQTMSQVDIPVFLDFEMPNKFKMPKFEKYDGTTCPKAHLQIYHVRMAPYVKKLSLIMLAFQASLTGLALRWYIAKNINLLDTWEEVVEAFMK